MLDTPPNPVHHPPITHPMPKALPFTPIALHYIEKARLKRARRAANPNASKYAKGNVR